MDSYLMMIYVTLEQESALKRFFLDQGWAYCKPDLSYTTDKIGPAAGTFPNVARDDDFLNTLNSKNDEFSGKRKLQTPYANSSKLKQMKLNKTSETVHDETNDNNEEKDHKKLETAEAVQERVVKKRASPITVEDIDGNSKAIKVEVTDEDDEYDPYGNCYSNSNDNSAMNDDYNDDTDADESYGHEGELLNDSQMSGSSNLDSSVNTDDKDPQTAGQKRKEMSRWNVQTPEPCTSERSFILKQGLNWTCDYKPAIKCTFCHKTFTSLSARKRHEKTVHAMEKNIKCDHCDEKFAYKWLMEAHAAKKHGVGKLFTCACGQTFNRQSNLTQHANICKMVQGPGNETVCKVCTKRFKCKKYLDVHMKFQHDITTLPSVCIICGESFTRPWSLTRHLKRRHAIVEGSSKDSEAASAADISNRDVDTDSEAELSNKETKTNLSKKNARRKTDSESLEKEIDPDSDETISSDRVQIDSNKDTKQDSEIVVKSEETIADENE